MLQALPVFDLRRQDQMATLNNELGSVESCVVKEDLGQNVSEVSSSIDQRIIGVEDGHSVMQNGVVVPNQQNSAKEPCREKQNPCQTKAVNASNTSAQLHNSVQLPVWSVENDMTIDEPYTYLLSHPGKDIRTQILTACNEWLKVDSNSFEVISRSIAMLHNASLLIDDIQDNSELRRGYPSAHKIFGIARTINAANHMYFKAQCAVMQLERHPHLHNIFNEELINLHRGQGMDLFWRDTFTVPTERDYLLMIANKTGGLFRLGVRMLQAVSNVNMDLVPLTDTLGLAFQIHDDYANLKSEKMAAAKGFCEDITEGKFSFPIIHAIKSCAPNDKEILYLLKSRTECLDVKRRAVHHMTHVTRSLQYTERTIEGLLAKANAQLQALEAPNPAFEAILAMLMPE